MELYIKEFLEKNKLPYTIYTHPAVFTCEEADMHCKHVPGIPGKNLFLKEEKGKQYFLIILPAQKKLDLKKFVILLKQKIKFGTEQELENILGVTPGSVSILGLLNDHEKRVSLIIDKEIWNADTVNFHPNQNTASLTFEKNIFHKLAKLLCENLQIETF